MGNNNGVIGFDTDHVAAAGVSGRVIVAGTERSKRLWRSLVKGLDTIGRFRHSGDFKRGLRVNLRSQIKIADMAEVSEVESAGAIRDHIGTDLTEGYNVACFSRGRRSA